MSMRVTCTVNGEQRLADDVWEGESLLYVLRERMGLPGSKNACEQGECGSCTVYLDGTPVCACLVAAGQAQDRDVVTVEGIGRVSWPRPGSRASASRPGALRSLEGGPVPSSFPRPPGSGADDPLTDRAETTRHGLAGDDDLDPVQQAFLDTGAVQCGFCTPGLIVAAHDLLRRRPHPDDAEVREALAGNLCRCTGYEKILEAVQLAAERVAR